PAAQLSERIDGLQHCGAPSGSCRRAARRGDGCGHERSPPGTDPTGRRPAGSGTVLVVSATTPGSEGLAGELRELDEAVGEAPLVVVPGEDLHHVAGDLGQLPVDD